MGIRIQSGMNDPTPSMRGDAESGVPPVPGRDPTVYEGAILDVHPKTMSMTVEIHTSQDHSMTPEVSIIPKAYDHESQTKEVSLYRRGTPVLVTRAPGYWVCLGAAPLVRFTSDESQFERSLTDTVMFGGEDPVYNSNRGVNYRGNSPADMLPGDWMLMGEEGNAVGVLAGGLSLLKGGPLSQIILSKLDDFVKIIARNLEIFSDFGEIRAVNNDGKLGLEINGSNDSINSNKHQDNWDYQIRLGGGDNLLTASFGKTRTGDTAFSITIAPNGRVTVHTADRVIVESQKGPSSKSTGDEVKDLNGNLRETVRGKRLTKNKGGVETHTSGSTKTLTSGSDYKHVGDEEVKQVAYTSNKKYGGVKPTATSTSARDIAVAMGDDKLEIGNPADAGIPAPILAGKSGSRIKVIWNGDDITQVHKGGIQKTTKYGDVIHETWLGEVTVSAGKKELPTSAKLVMDPKGKFSLGSQAVGSAGTKMDVPTILAKIVELLGNEGPAGYGAPLLGKTQYLALMQDIKALLIK